MHTTHRFSVLLVISCALPLLAIAGCASPTEREAAAASVGVAAVAADSRDWRRELTMSDYSTVVEGSSGLYVVLVKADACGKPCSDMSRSVTNVLEVWRSRASFGTVNPETAPELADYLKIRSLPTTFLYRDGVVVAQTIGAMSENKFADWMIQHAL